MSRLYTQFSGIRDLFSVKPPLRYSLKERQLVCEFRERLFLARKKRKKLLRMVDPTEPKYHGHVQPKDVPFIRAKIANLEETEAQYVAWLKQFQKA